MNSSDKLQGTVVNRILNGENINIDLLSGNKNGKTTTLKKKVGNKEITINLNGAPVKVLEEKEN